MRWPSPTCLSKSSALVRISSDWPSGMNGSKTLPTAVRFLIRLNCWKMKPSFLRLTTSCSTSFMEVRSLVVDGDRAGAGGIEGAQQVEERALARARRADDEREGALGHLERDAAQGFDLLFAALIRLSQVRDAYHAEAPACRDAGVGRRVGFKRPRCEWHPSASCAKRARPDRGPAAVAITIAVRMLIDDQAEA